MRADSRSLRRGAVALLAAAAAVAAWRHREPPSVEILAVDLSRSVVADGAGAAQLLAAEGEPAGRGIVAFGRHAVALRRPGDLRPIAPEEAAAAREAVDPSGTEVDAGLRAAAALVPRGARGTVVVVSDGRHRDAGRARVEPLTPAGDRVGVLARAPAAAPPPAPRVAAVDVPPVCRAGDVVPVGVTVVGAPGAAGVVRLEDVAASRAGSRPFRLPEGGRARVVFAVPVAAPGLRAFIGRAEGPLVDVAVRAATLVEDGGGVLRVGTRPAAPGVADLLRGVAGRPAVDGALPDADSDLDALSMIVLDDVPESFLGAGGGERIRDAVARGLGLVVLGGPATLGAGGWTARPLEEGLPVRCAPPRPRPLVILALDVSGSMEGPGGGAPGPAAAAREAAAALAAGAPRDALLALVRFSDHVEAMEGPFDLATAEGRAAAMAAASRRPTPAGGTRFGAAVDGALRAVAGAPGGGRRLLLLVTDGLPAEDEATLVAAANRLRAASVDVRIHVVGGEAGGGTAAFAAAAGGSVAEVAASVDGPALARLLSAAVTAEDAAWSGDTMGVRAVGGAGPAGLPPVAGRNRVHAREGAETLLALEDGAPLLVVGRHGLGHVAVFAAAPAAGDGAWVRAPAADLLREAFRRTRRRDGDRNLRVTALRLPDGRVRVRAESPPAALPPAGIAAAGVVLQPAGPGCAEGMLAAEPPGGIIVVAGSDGAVLARAPVVDAPSPEDAATGTDAAALAALRSPGPTGGSRGRGAAGAPGAALAAAGVLLLVVAAAAESRSAGGTPRVQDGEGRNP